MSTATLAGDSRQPLGASVNIPPRRMDFGFEPTRTGRYYFAGDPSKTALITALSVLFPHGEAFFVESVRRYRQRIHDPLLKAQVAGFIGQEAMHSKEHRLFNEVATAHGFPAAGLERTTDFLLKLVGYLPNSICLAVTVCLEHYTAIFAEMLLRDEELQRNFSPETRGLWLWHALEENEHKTVAFDVYEQTVRSRLLLQAVMVPTTLIFFGVVFAFWLRLLAADGRLFAVRGNWDTLVYAAGRRGKLSRLLPQYLDFFRRRFHPDQHDTNALLDSWRERLFGRDGELRGSLRNPEILAQAAKLTT